MTAPPPSDRPYPPGWEDVAELKVRRGPASQWEKLPAWTAEMRRRGWRLLRVTTEGDELVAVYGRTRTR